MTSRHIVVVVLAAAVAFAALGWLALSQSDKPSPTRTEGVSGSSADQLFRDPYPDAKEVRLFVETDYTGNEPTYVNPKGRVLTEGQRAEFESLIAIHTISPDEAFAACFIPHHFFRYFDDAGKLVGEIEVCFCCAGVQQSEGSSVRLSEGQMLVADFRRLKSFVASLGERTDVGCD